MTIDGSSLAFDHDEPLRYLFHCWSDWGHGLGYVRTLLFGNDDSHRSTSQVASGALPKLPLMLCKLYAILSISSYPLLTVTHAQPGLPPLP